MKKLISLLASFSLAASMVPAAVRAGDCYADPVYRFSGSGSIKSAVFLRTNACMTGSSVLKTLSTGTSVSVIGYTDGWYFVDAAGTRGWIGEQFLVNEAVQSDGNMSYSDFMSAHPSGTNSTPAPAPKPTNNGEEIFSGTISPRYLIKLACPVNAASDHPCHAVYYIGADGKRHAFPNSKVFFTWYLNFDNVRAVSAERLGQYALGANITYRPGLRMVKFTTDPKVYVVARGGVLRWIKTEALANAYYGSDWNRKIDDIPDTFYTNYTFGADINQESDFDPTAETSSAATFD